MPKETTPPTPELFINRELSLLDFQSRVLEEAQDENNPLLERVKFLAIFGSNMDEFFMVRVSGLRKQVDAGIIDVSPDGMTPREQLAAIRKRYIELDNEAHQCLQRKILPKLDKAGIHIVEYEKASKAQKEKADAYFHEVVYPVLTPLALDLGHPFPHISNLSLNLAVVIRDPKGNEKFARLKVPGTLPRLIPIKRSSGSTRRDGTIPFHHYFMWLEQVIAANVGALFPGMEIVSVHPFRIVRDADTEIQEIEADDLLESMQQTIRQRKFGLVAQVSVYDDLPSNIRELLIENLEIKPGDVFVQRKPLGLINLWQIYNSVERHDLKYPVFKQHIHKGFRNVETAEDVFEAIRQRNILLHHPYDSFSPVVDFLNTAARDPNVLAIKQTLYRVGRDSPVVSALLEARERGKQVAVLLELKARFDEESNIGWARKLEEAGVHVVYGLVDLKTHSKVAMVIRQEGEGIRRYVHLATGNYNHFTSYIYEDIGVFTCDESIGADATDLFNYLTGYSAQTEYRKLLVAPVNLRQKMEALIHREIEHARKGDKARLIFKINSLVDPEMIRLLYAASQAGVKIDLFVRGMCCLRAGLKGVSENIRVISIVGRYLEHSRIFYFYNAGKEEIYLGSADLMQRNLNNRVEVVFPVEREDNIRHLRDNVLEAYLRDNTRARLMKPDGTYIRLQPKEKEEKFDVQQWLMNRSFNKKKPGQ
ncbi:MAG: polyphosphate kinase 1 [Anaerolineales bacterium]|nr:polyphosphate kinase 1 [Anaerolineae bacterium]PWB74671.1 MAG: polyphosphate kinase 1 [Anaerolineales bacterium]